MEDTSLIISIEERRHSNFTEDEIKELTDRVTGMAVLNGIQIQDQTSSQFRVGPIPFTLFPCVLPRKVFDEARRLQTHFQTVMYKVANDHDFLYKCFKSIIPADGFIRSLWNIYEIVRQEQPNQISVMFTRNDFMVADDPTQGDLCIKQVEINTFAVGSTMMKSMTDLHRYCLTITDTEFKGTQLPDIHTTVAFAQAICKVWKLYNKPKSVVLFVVEDVEPSQEQRYLERDMFNTDPCVPVMYRKFSQLLEQVSLTDDKRLFIENKEVAVVYYRTGFVPQHYPTEKYFDIRLDLERSKAIKCPSIAIHLAGCKKVQQVLSEPGVLEQFLDDSSLISDLRKTFVEQVVLDQDAVQRAKQNPDRYVLKPQREGGGNNIFDEEITTQIDSIYNSPDASSWIMMDRIRGHCHRTRLIRGGGDFKIRDVVSELGIYGVHIGTPTEEMVNYECGYLLRTKPVETNEGGLDHGFSCMDSLFLID